MKIISCNQKEIQNIKNNKQLYKIFNNKIELSYLENCVLHDESANESLDIQITSIKYFSSPESILQIYNLNSFGEFTGEDDFIKYVKDNYNSENILVCRIKKCYGDITLEDKKILDLIDPNNLIPEKLGLSGCLVYRTMTKDNKRAILKIQNIEGNDSLKEEYDVLNFLKGKINCGKPYYYNKLDNKEYLLREYIDGEPLYKYKNFGFKLGEELKKIHLNFSENCIYQKFSTKNLLNNVLNKIDIIYQIRPDFFSNYTKEELIDFLRNNKPEDDALIHGDFSLTNIIVNNDIYYYIDLGNVSISTKYFDIYVLQKSLKINNLESEFSEFLRGYNLNRLNENYMHWMELIELSYN